MSLEAEIKANTEALKALTAALAGIKAGTTALNAPNATAAPAAASNVIPLATAAAPQAASVASGSTPEPKADVGAITKESLKAKVLALAAKDEPAAIALMAPFGGSLPKCPVERYAELDAALNAAAAPAAAGSLV